MEDFNPLSAASLPTDAWYGESACELMYNRARIKLIVGCVLCTIVLIFQFTYYLVVI
jgi:hypothetical protein